MARLTRAVQKIFASNAVANKIAKFGSLAAGSPTRYSGATITPALVQALSNFLEGWNAAVVGSNSPAIEDMEAVCWLYARQLAYMFENGVAEWDAETSYFIGSLVNVGGVLYVSKTDDNLNNPVTDAVNWKKSVDENALLVQQNITTRVWTAQTASSSSWRGTAWGAGAGVFASVGTSGSFRAQTSPDGVTWTDRTASSITTQWFGIAWSESLGLFAAVGGSPAYCMTSPDGITWTTRTIPTGNTYRAICWSDSLSLFVAVGDSATISTSPDGITWTSRTAPGSGSIQCVCFAEDIGLFVAGGRTANYLITSPDGITWTNRTSPISPVNGYNAVCRSPELGLFLAFASSSDVVSSPDGITWTAGTLPEAIAVTGCVWSSELRLFVAVGSATGGVTHNILTSADGVNWIGRVTSGFTNHQGGVCWSPELSLFIVTDSAQMERSL